MFELNEASTDTPSPKDAAIVVRSRLGLEPAEVRRFLTGLRQVVDAYTLLFCVDFMSELGQRFNKEDRPEIDVQKFTRLESVFETLAH